METPESAAMDSLANLFKLFDEVIDNPGQVCINIPRQLHSKVFCWSGRGAELPLAVSITRR